MGILDRAHTVMNSNFNAWLRRLEDPGKDIALLVSELGEQIRAAQRELISVLGETKRNTARVGAYDLEIERWEKRAELAVRNGDDKLAREALGQKRRVLEEKQRCNADRLEQLRVLAAMKQEVERMKMKHAEIANSQHIVAAQVSIARSSAENGTGRVEALGQATGVRPFEALEQFESAIERSEAEATAATEIDLLLGRTKLGTMTEAELLDQVGALVQQEQAQSDEALAKRAQGDSPEAVLEIAADQTLETEARVRVKIES